MERQEIQVTEHREIVGILMESSFYFELSLAERYSLIKHLVKTKMKGESLTH
jgi:hypothetical protein